MNKLFTLLTVGVLALIVGLNAVSALITMSPATYTNSVTQGNSVSFNVAFTNTNAVDLNDVALLVSGFQSGTNVINTDRFTYSYTPLTVIPGNDGTITVQISIPSNQPTATYTGQLVFVGDFSGTPETMGSVNVSLTVNPSSSGISQFCNITNPGELEITVEDIVNNGIGEDDTWYPFDTLEVELSVENGGDEDVEDVTVEWGLYGNSNDQWIIEVQDEDEFDVNEGDEETLTISIDLDDDLDVDLEDLEDGEYTLYVRATGTVDDDSSSETCASDYSTNDIVIESDYVILDDVEVIGTPSCDSTVQISAKVWNIGSDDQDDVVVLIHNSELKLSELVEVGDIDAFDDKTINFQYTIPAGTAEKKYNVILEVYDEDNDIYENSDDEESSLSTMLDVSGCQLSAKASVLASLESGGKAGQEMKIKATITNNGLASETFTIESADYSSWAESATTSPSTLTLAKGQSGDAIITLNVKKDAAEKQNFNVIVRDSKGNVMTQPIAVTVEKSAGLRSLFSSDKGYIWGIAIANLVLIIIIIFVAVRAMRR